MKCQLYFTKSLPISNYIVLVKKVSQIADDCLSLPNKFMKKYGNASIPKDHEVGSNSEGSRIQKENQILVAESFKFCKVQVCQNGNGNRFSKREGSQKDTESAKVSEKERRTERGMEKVESG